jgi:hypothetical protein
VQYGFEQMNFSPASLRENQQSGATQGVDFPSSLGAEKLAHCHPSWRDRRATLGLSLRTLHRRLARERLSYQLVLDNIRRSVATEFLENTHLSRRAGRFDAGARERAVVSARPPFAQARCKRGGPS